MKGKHPGEKGHASLPRSLLFLISLRVRKCRAPGKGPESLPISIPAPRAPESPPPVLTVANRPCCPRPASWPTSRYTLPPTTHGVPGSLQASDLNRRSRAQWAYVRGGGGVRRDPPPGPHESPGPPRLTNVQSQLNVLYGVSRDAQRPSRGQNQTAAFGATFLSQGPTLAAGT